MILSDESITIRRLRIEDKCDYCLVLSDPRVSNTLRGVVPGRDGITLLSKCTQAELGLKFDSTLQRTIDGKHCFFAVIVVSTGRFIGLVGSYPIDRERMGLSYWISSEHQGCGLGTKIFKMYCSPALKFFNRKIIIANVARDNPASAAVVQKAGFVPSNRTSDTGFDITCDRELFEWSESGEGNNSY